MSEIENEIKRQADRFFRHPGLSDKPEESKRQLDELRKALRRCCATAEAVRLAGEALMLKAKYFPLPADVEIAAEATRMDAAQSAQKAICPLCQGDGFGSAPPAFRESNGTLVRYERVSRCSCDRQASFEDRVRAGEYRPPTEAERHGDDEFLREMGALETI